MNEAIQAHYQSLLAVNGDSHVSAQWSSRESQEARYAILAQIADLQGADVLDFGCGTGHLATYLAQQGVNVRYTGVDIVQEFLELARNKHPHHRFGLIQDFEGGEMFDWVLVSGVFNNRTENNGSFFRNYISRLWKMSKKGIAFNLMSAYVDFEDPELWYADPGDVYAFMKSLTPFVAIRNDYVVKDTQVPFEFAVYAYRQPRWRPG
jgi:SAM-dependent methyltransferase